ncbi:MAG: hypothetical protein QM697_04695 [Lachnospiraceae bacterium]
MARIVKTKKLVNARLLKEYASWIYCTSCEKTVAYLCYITYDKFDFQFTCNCGCHGSVSIDFGDLDSTQASSQSLMDISNRMCCPNDKSPLITLVEKNLQSYNCRISCLKCGREFSQSKE